MTDQFLLQEESVSDALEAMRVGRALREHPLRHFRSVQAHLETPHLLAGDAAVQYAIYRHLAHVITEQLGRLRQIVHLPPPDVECSEFNMAEDYRHNNAELEAWSLLYHRFVCINHDVPPHELARLGVMNERTTRRRQALGITRLTHELVERERLFRRNRKREHLLLALPTRHPPRLFGKESAKFTSYHLLTEADPPRHVTLHGPAGIGKSVLAKSLVYDLVTSEHFDDFLWLEVDHPAYILADISMRLGLSSGDDTLAPLDGLRAYLFEHPVLIALDGAENLIGHAQCADVLAALDTASVVLTSQRVPPPDIWCYTIELSELTHDQAFEFLDDAARQLPVRCRHIWADNMDDIWRIAGGNPQALKWVLHASCSLPLNAVIPFQHDLTAVIARLWDQLTAAERRIMLLPAIEAAISYDQILTLSRLDAIDVNRAVESLVHRAVLLPHHDAHTIRYTLQSISLPALVEHIRRGLEITSRDTALNYIRDVVAQMVIQLESRTDCTAASQALNIVKLTHDLGFAPDERWRCAYRLAVPITAGALWPSWAKQMALLLTLSLTPAQTVWVQRSLGIALRWLGQLDQAQAYLDQAHMYYAGGDRVEYAQVMIEQAVIYRYQLRWDAAREFAQAALMKYQQAGFSDGIARCYHEMAQLALDAREPLSALQWLDRLDNWTPRTWGIASQVYLALEQHEHACEAAKHTLDNLPLTHPNCGRATATLGQIYYELGDLNAAVTSLLSAVLLLNEVKDMLGYARACNNLAVAYLARAEIDSETDGESSQRAREIRNLLQRARGIQEHTGDEMGLAVTQRNLGWFSDHFPED